MDAHETCPLPEDPTLAAWATALNQAGQWAEIFDSDWRFVYMTDDERLMYGGQVELAEVPLGLFATAPRRLTFGCSGPVGSFRWRSSARDQRVAVQPAERGIRALRECEIRSRASALRCRP